MVETFLLVMISSLVVEELLLPLLLLMLVSPYSVMDSLVVDSIDLDAVAVDTTTGLRLATMLNMPQPILLTILTSTPSQSMRLRSIKLPRKSQL